MSNRRPSSSWRASIVSSSAFSSGTYSRVRTGFSSPRANTITSGRRAACEAVLRAPELHERILDGVPFPVEDASAEYDAPAGELVLLPAGEADREERSDGLRRRPHGSKGVRRTTMSKRYPSAHSGSVVSRSNL